MPSSFMLSACIGGIFDTRSRGCSCLLAAADLKCTPSCCLFYSRVADVVVVVVAIAVIACCHRHVSRGVSVFLKDIIDGNSILILGLVWQIIRIQLLSSIRQG